jgi:hypothetical protein
LLLLLFAPERLSTLVLAHVPDARDQGIVNGVTRCRLLTMAASTSIPNSCRIIRSSQSKGVGTEIKGILSRWKKEKKIVMAWRKDGAFDEVGLDVQPEVILDGS